MPNPKETKRELSVGEVAERSGVAVSAIHFYEAKGLVGSKRNGGNQRRYPREILRRIAIIKVAQRAGVPLELIGKALSSFPEGRTPNAREWRKLATDWKAMLQERIDSLTMLRDQLHSCIGCGCLSLADCPLRNPEDELAKQGVGAVLLQPRRKNPPKTQDAPKTKQSSKRAD